MSPGKERFPALATLLSHETPLGNLSELCNRRGETLIDLVMGAVLPIVGGIAGTLFFRQFTSLPMWGCFLLGLPLGTVTAWCGFVALAYVVAVPAEKWSEWRRRKRRQQVDES